MLRVALPGIFCAVALISSARAADLAAPAASYKDSPNSPRVNWAGFYEGVNGGYGWSGGNTTLNADYQIGLKRGSFPELRFDKNGGFGGVQIGYNRQWGRFVYGLEADFQGGNISGSGSSTTGIVPVTLAMTSTLDWFGTVRGRIGYTYENALFYVTRGFAYGQAHGTASVSVSGALLGERDLQGTPLGRVLGGGAEFAFSPAWSIKAEYLHIDFKEKDRAFSYSGPAGGSFAGTVHGNQDYDIVRLGLNYHLPSAYGPLN
jgi:outer membrane immunogenic protein